MGSEARSLPGEPSTFEKLRELSRNGYVPDARQAPDTPGLRLRHDHAPDLILYPDGRLELPVGQPTKRRAEPIESRAEKRVYWWRTFLVVALTVAIWFLSLATAATLFEMTGP